MQTIHRRGELSNLKKAIQSGSVNLGFAGGSITTATTVNNWPTYLRGWFLNAYNGVRLNTFNAAIGATGSLCGLLLAEQELIRTECDLVLVEYAVNDNDVDAEERMRTREGLIRKLLRANIDVVLVYTFYQNMYDEMKDGGVPQSIQDLEQLAEHYNLSSVFMAQEAYEQVQRGIIPWNAWLPDGTHPHHIGSYFYANAVIAFLQEELSTPNPCTVCKGDALPAPVNQKHWENTADIAFDTVTTHGAWSVAREVHIPWFDRRLMTYGLGDWLEFTFEGRGLAIVFSYGKSSGLIEYQLDGGDWQPYVCQRYWWMPEENFVNAVRMFDDLPDGKHHVKLRVSHANTDGCNSSNCNILKLCAVK